MEMIFDICMIIVFVIFLAERISAYFWNDFFYRSGIVVFRDVLFNQNQFKAENINTDYLEFEFSKTMWQTIIFKKISDCNIGFREKVFEKRLLSYFPIMHGRIHFDDSSGRIIVTGQIYWYIILISIIGIMFYRISSDLAWVFALYVIFFVGSYLFQVSRFKKVARVLNDMIS